MPRILVHRVSEHFLETAARTECQAIVITSFDPRSDLATTCECLMPPEHARRMIESLKEGTTFEMNAVKKTRDLVGSEGEDDAT